MPPPVTCSAVEPTAAAIAELSTLFEQYRAHYGETPEFSATTAWIAEMARSGELTFYGAHQGPRLAAFAAVHVVPASLRLRRFWQLRDLFVRPDARRLGVARRLIDVIRHDAVEAGALRLSVQTEPGNAAALTLYRRAGFTVNREVTTLSLDLG